MPSKAAIRAKLAPPPIPTPTPLNGAKATNPTIKANAVAAICYFASTLAGQTLMMIQKKNSASRLGDAESSVPDFRTLSAEPGKLITVKHKFIAKISRRYIICQSVSAGIAGNLVFKRRDTDNP